MLNASRQALPPAHLLSLAVATALLAPAAHADFVADSKASLTTTNIYLNRDFREGDGQRWEQARYGEFRVEPDGRALLVGMADAQLRPIVP